MIFTSTISTPLKIGLQFLGLWPDMPYSSVYPLIFVSSILIMQFFQYLYVFAHLNLLNLVESLPVTVDYSLTLLKLVALWVHRRVIHQMLADMNYDWRECINVNQRLHAMTVKANMSHIFSKVMVSFNTSAVIVYLLGSYVFPSVNLMEENNDTSRQFPIKIQFPFETKQSPIFELIVVLIFIYYILNAYTIAIMNTLLYSLVFHVSGQIEIICQDFKTISKKALVYDSSTSPLRMLIERHNRVISFSDNIDKLFSFIALIQAICNGLIICLLGFVIITSLDIGIDVVFLVRSIFAYIAIIVEVFLFCFAGEYLSLKSKSIAGAAYESLWYDIPLNQRRMVSFMIMRSQRQLTITAGKITYLSLEVFASIMKASASYVSVLYAVY